MVSDMLNQFGNWLHNVFVGGLSPWVILGMIAQALFTMRFLVQWIASERARRSVVPAAFWTFSIVGGALLLVYAIYREDPVFILGQAAGLVIYFRNVWFIMAERRQRADVPATFT